MRIDLIAQIIEDEGLGTIGVDIFAYRMDADCHQGILLRAPLDGVPVNVELPNYFKHSLQVVVRSPDQQTGDALAAALQKLLTIYNRVFLDDSGALLMQLNHLVPRTLPRVYPRLDGQGIEWSMDFNTNYVMPL